MGQEALAIVGDVHGQVDALRTALRTYEGQRRVVLVGDYVNRGPRSAEVVELLTETLGSDDVVALLGNHDHAFLEFIRDGDLAPFAQMGGLSTINSYIGGIGTGAYRDFHDALTTRLPADHLAVLRSLEHFYEEEALFVSHCGVSPRRFNERGIDQVVLGSHPELFGEEAEQLPKVVVAGHYAQRSQQPFVSERFICVDSGCGTVPGAPLTVLEWPERRFKYIEVR